MIIVQLGSGSMYDKELAGKRMQECRKRKGVTQEVMGDAIGSYDVCNIGKYIKSSPSKKRYKTWTKLMHFGMKKFIQKKFDVDYVFNDGDVFEKYGIKLEIVHLPGHTNGSIGILYDKYLFCGDALVNRKRKVEIAYQNEDNIAAEKSILKIMDIKPEIIFVGHDREIHFSKLKKSFSNVF